MQVTVNIPDELAAQVEARGVALDAYLRAIIQEKLSQEQSGGDKRQDAIDAMLQFAEKHGATLEAQENGIKNMIHEGHKF